jgi:DNA primase
VSPPIPQDYIDDLLARSDLVALIGARVELRRSGHEYIGRCPFHEERTPSFTVSPQKGRN